MRFNNSIVRIPAFTGMTAILTTLATCVVLFCACATTPPPPPKPVVQALPPPKPKEPPPNLEVVVYEVVDSPENDGIARTKVYLDGQYTGQTDAGLKSLEKKWVGRVADGNRLVRLERWVFPRVWDWQRAPDDAQPHERFIRMKPGMRTKVVVRFSDDGRESSLQVAHEKLPPEPPAQPPPSKLR